MNITAEILRDCAYGLPREEGSKDALLDDMEMARTGSPFICDHLDRMVKEVEKVEGVEGVEGAEEQLYIARSFLHELSAAHPAVVEKIILEDKTSLVASRELGLHEGTVLSRLRAAVRQLRARTAPWLPQSQRDAR